MVTAVVRWKGTGGVDDSKVSNLGRRGGWDHHSLTTGNRSHCEGGICMTGRLAERRDNPRIQI